MMCKANVGGLDRALRAIVGLVLISLVFIGPQTPWGWLGVIPLATAIFKICPAYSILGLNTVGKCCGTCKKPDNK